MGFLDGVEKLITEHGSAAILKERIALLNDQHAAVERKLAASEKSVIDLTERNAALERELATLRIINDKSEVRMPEERERVLKVVCFHQELDTPQIAAIAEITPQLTQWHLDTLKKAKLISVQYTLGSDWDGSPSRSEWSVQPAGRHYLAEHGMLT